jgi:long-chain acyl-CoA synthetase
MRRNGSDPAIKGRKGYYTKHGQEWRGTTFEEYYQKCQQAARALLSLGMEPGDSICILSFNRPEWVISDLACMMAGGVPAGIYQTSSPEEVEYILNHSEAIVAVVENEEQWRKVDAKRENLTNLKKIVVMDIMDTEDPMTLSWEAFMALGDSVPPEKVDERIDSLEPAQRATYIYTSGTTGPPKAVMISHGNLEFTASAASELVELTENDCVLSYLPLSHIAEQMFSIHAPVSTGGCVYFAESIEKLPENLKEVQPTIFFGVPRIWEKFYAKIAAGLKEAPPARQKIAAKAMKTGKAVNSLRNRGEEPGLLLGLKYRLFKKLVYDKFKEKIGMGRAKVCVSGAAPISAEILEFLSGLDLVVHEVYGQSEDCGPTSFNRPGATKFGSVGPVFPGVDVKLAEDDEILVKGKNVFLGYYKDKEATDSTLIDGWLHSGDLGKFDGDGYLTIIGRKKEIIITAGGKNITPKNIEAALKDLELVSQAVVIGDRRKFLSALVTLDEEAAGKFAGDNGLSKQDLHGNPKIIQKLQEGVDNVNKKLARVENVRKFKVLPRDFTIEDRELTPTLKVKRREVYKNWADEIESIYEE